MKTCNAMSYISVVSVNIYLSIFYLLFQSSKNFQIKCHALSMLQLALEKTASNTIYESPLWLSHVCLSILSFLS